MLPFAPDQEGKTATTEPAIITQPIAGSAAIATTSTDTGSSNIEGVTSFDVWIETSQMWVKKFKEADPSARSLMLIELLEAFADGQDGVQVSFSEPT